MVEGKTIREIDEVATVLEPQCPDVTGRRCLSEESMALINQIETSVEEAIPLQMTA